MNFSGAKSQSTPPERGSFPLDHGASAARIRRARSAAPSSQAASDDMKNIGMDDSQTRGNRVDHEGVRESGGFVAGLHIDERKSILPFRGPAGKGHARLEVLSSGARSLVRIPAAIPEQREDPQKENAVSGNDADDADELACKPNATSQEADRSPKPAALGREGGGLADLLATGTPKAPEPAAPRRDGESRGVEGGGETKDAKKSRKESLGADAPRKKKKAKKARRLTADPFAAAEQEAGANGRKVLCSMTGTIKGHHGLEFKYGAALTGVWAYRQEHLETTHALKRAAGAVPRNRDRARECPPAPRFTMTVLEKEPGTLVCQGTFTDDPALWGHGAAPARSRGRRAREPAEAPLFTTRPEITGAGKSHYGDYDVTGTLARAPGDTHAKLRLTKFKKPKPWYYDPCVVCGEEGDTATLLLCDGQDKHCKNAAHLACVGLDAVPDGEWFCPDCAKPQCAASCVCRRRL
ncbi:hypothetical protein JL721_8914 [Aureococcus anophagefferens]|nr:hypothetical protein JL721_8914 [Aureococcus anophagefferens]